MDTRDEIQEVNVRVQVVYRKNNVVAVRHNLRREVSPYWLEVLLENIQVKVDGGNFVQEKVTLR